METDFKKMVVGTLNGRIVSSDEWDQIQADLLSKMAAPRQLGAWKTEAPPKDGKPVVAVGRVIASDGFSTWADPFAAAIFWHKTQSGFEGWCLWLNEYKLAVARQLEDEVKIDCWLEYPN